MLRMCGHERCLSEPQTFKGLGGPKKKDHNQNAKDNDNGPFLRVDQVPALKQL